MRAARSGLEQETKAQRVLANIKIRPAPPWIGSQVKTGFSRASEAGGRVAFPDGTVIAKEIFAVTSPGPADKPVMITGMVKAPGDPDARSGWLWLTKDLASGKESVYTGDFCVRCHANANEMHPYGSKNPSGAFSDYVFFIPGDDATVESTGS